MQTYTALNLFSGNTMKKATLTLLLMLLATISIQAQDVQQKRRDAILNDKKYFDLDEFWVYDDFEKGRQEAEKTGKPLLVVLRCLP